jgi:hypothetical protein
MEFAADVLVVAGRLDAVANRSRRDLEMTGRQVEMLDGPSAARLFTISVRPDQIVVAPSLPMFVRASAWWYDQSGASADEQFLRAEAYATFWAAAALSKTPVINRTGPRGGVGRMTAGALAAAIGAADPVFDIHASGPEIIEANADETIWGEDFEFRVASIAEMRHGEPLRARKVNLAALHEIVTVVGSRAFSATADPRTAELGLLEHSLALCRALELHFATITWAIDGQGATPVRLNPAPEEPDLRYAWRDVSEALCADLTR